MGCWTYLLQLVHQHGRVIEDIGTGVVDVSCQDLVDDPVLAYQVVSSGFRMRLFARVAQPSPLTTYTNTQ